jgi:hypothetical protein
MPMKTAGQRLFVSIMLIILFVIGIVGFVLVIAGVATYCAIGLGCSGPTIIGLYASTIIEAWPFMLLFLVPFAIFGGAVFLSLKEGKSEK